MEPSFDEEEGRGRFNQKPENDECSNNFEPYSINILLSKGKKFPYASKKTLI